jgi:pimeloyl-[acyl-carrier protein] synthase
VATVRAPASENPCEALTLIQSKENLLPMLFDPEFRADPYPTYRELLANDAPVHLQGEGWQTMNVTRHDQVTALLRDPRMVRGNPTNTWTPPDAWKPWFDLTGNWMLFRDPPSHTRLRGLVSTAFTPRAIERLRGQISALARELIVAACAKGEFDLIAEYAFELPVRVIADMLGVPHRDHAKFRAWSHVLAQAIDFNMNDAFMNEAAQTASELDAYVRALIDEKRTHPGEDILSGIVHAELDGDRLSIEEVVGTVALLLFAGHETTVNLIGNGTLAFLNNPDQLALLKQQPALIANATEEVLRFNSPVQATTRTTAEAFSVGGVTFEQGWEIMLWLGAANHDPRVFDITRSEIKHLSFGGGIHYCIGASLARMEGQIAFATLFEHAPNLALASETQQWRGLTVLRGLATLPVYAGG